MCLVSVLSLPAFAGRGIIVGNGGQSVRCVRDDGSAMFQSFDLFEGSVHFHYAYPAYPNERSVELALRMAAKIDQAQGGYRFHSGPPIKTVSERVKWVAANMLFMAQGETLDPTGDAGEYQVFPDHCELVQTIDFREPSIITVNTDVWKSLSTIDRAALYLHEAVYWFLRDAGVEKDSRRTRRIVSYLLSGGELIPVGEVPDDVSRSVQYCHSVKETAANGWKTQLLIYRTGGKPPVIQVLRAGGYSFVNQFLIQSQGPGEAFEAPLDPDSPELHKMSGISTFPMDVETVLELTWGQGQMLLAGEIQRKSPVSDSLVCETWGPTGR